MKQINKILVLISFLGFSLTYAQLDTLNYLKQFEVNKASYIGQPFSKLLNDMTQIQPKTAWPTTIGNKKIITEATIFKFCDKEYSFHNAIFFWVKWQDEIPSTQTEYYGRKNNWDFTNEEKTFYGNKIVQDIKVFR